MASGEFQASAPELGMHAQERADRRREEMDPGAETPISWEGYTEFDSGALMSHSRGIRVTFLREAHFGLYIHQGEKLRHIFPTAESLAPAPLTPSAPHSTASNSCFLLALGGRTEHYTKKNTMNHEMAMNCIGEPLKRGWWAQLPSYMMSTISGSQIKIHTGVGQN